MNLQSTTDCFGLDISDQALRLVQLKKRGKKIFITAHNELAIPAEIIKDGEILQEKKLGELIGQLIKTSQGSKVKTKNVISVLPETKTFIKLITLEASGTQASKKSLPSLIKKEIVNHIPLPVDELYLDWQVMSKNPLDVLVGAVPKEVSDSFVRVLELARLSPQVLEIEAAAIIRSLIPAGDKKSRMIIDFGANRSSLIVYGQSSVQFTVSLPISGEQITQKIATTLNLTYKQSEKVKLVCGLDEKKCEGALRKILFGAINDLATQIKKAMGYYNDHFPKHPALTEITLCGGGANFINIDSVLSEKLKLPITIGNPLAAAIIQHKKAPIPKEKLLSYTTAIGLALRTFEHNG